MERSIPDGPHPRLRNPKVSLKFHLIPSVEVELKILRDRYAYLTVTRI